MIRECTYRPGRSAGNTFIPVALGAKVQGPSSSA
jgi:hypothetical protein